MLPRCGKRGVGKLDKRSSCWGKKCMDVEQPKKSLSTGSQSTPPAEKNLSDSKVIFHCWELPQKITPFPSVNSRAQDVNNTRLFIRV
jgi:hypothetical protein